MRAQRITKVIRTHPLGTVNVCARFHANLCSQRQDISWDNMKLFDCGDAKEKVRRSALSD